VIAYRGAGRLSLMGDVMAAPMQKLQEL
jgi:hypothetical protein